MFQYFTPFTNNIDNSVLYGLKLFSILFYCISSYSPNYRVPIPLIGNIQLKYIALSLIILDLVNIEINNPEDIFHT